MVRFPACNPTSNMLFGPNAVTKLRLALYPRVRLVPGSGVFAAPLVGKNAALLADRPCRPRITCPKSLVVVENCCFSSVAVLASRTSTRPRSVASSALNCSCSFCKVARSSFFALSAVEAAIKSFTRSMQAFNPAANS